jgi:endoglucanase
LVNARRNSFAAVAVLLLAAYRVGLDRVVLARLPFPTGGATAESMRYYCALGWDRAAIGKRIGTAAAWARAHSVRLLAGEFGASNALNAPARMAWLSTVRQALEESGIGWALWGYDDIMGFAVPRPPVARPILDPNILIVLGMPPKR